MHWLEVLCMVGFFIVLAAVNLFALAVIVSCLTSEEEREE